MTDKTFFRFPFTSDSKGDHDKKKFVALPSTFLEQSIGFLEFQLNSFTISGGFAC